MNKNYTYEQLIEKIALAKASLIATERRHTCMIDMDPDYTGPCTCGASKHNNEIATAIAHLKL